MAAAVISELCTEQNSQVSQLPFRSCQVAQTVILNYGLSYVTNTVGPFYCVDGIELCTRGTLGLSYKLSMHQR